MLNLDSEDEADRRYAAEDLGELRNPAAIPKLVKTLRDPVIAVREAAADALINIGGEKVCEAIVPLLDHDDATLRNLALEVLERLHADSIEACIELYNSESNDLRKVAIDTLGKIEEVREHEKAFIFHASLQ